MPEERPLDKRGLPEGYAFREGWEVTPREVRRMLEAGEPFTFIDCRTPREYEAARIEGAKLVPLQALGERLEELEKHKGEKVVVHCHLGGRSLQMAAILRQQGFEDVTSMAGGIDLWSRDVDADVPRY